MEAEPEAALDPRAEEVRADIARTREEVAASVQALRDELALRVDWREWVRRRPVLFIAGAFLLGVALGAHRDD